MILSTMDSNEVIIATQALNISNFLGVFAADQLCSIKSNQVGTMVVNTDPFHLAGQHWISLCLDDKDIYLYDPLLLNVHKLDFFSTFFIRMNKVLHFNSIKIQRPDSVMCGYHALVFCFVMKNGGCGQKFRSFLESFASYNVSNREQLSLTYYTIIRKYDSKSDVKS